MAAARASRSGPPLPRLLFLAMLGVWVVMPLLVRGNLAQDAVPVLAAGDLARTTPDAVYGPGNGDLFALDPRFAARVCELSPPDTDCEQTAIAFVGTPLYLPLAAAVARLGGDVGVLAMRLVASLALAGGMWLVWERVAGSSRQAPAALAATAVLLTPLAMDPIVYGQTSPLLFLSACLGVGAATWRAGIGRGVLWAVVSVIKGFPVVLAPLLLLTRRYRVVVAAAATLVVLAGVFLVGFPTELVGRFIASSSGLSGQTGWSPVTDVAHQLVPAVGESTAVTAAFLVVRLAAVLALFVAVRRRVDGDAQWAVGYLLLLWVVPVVWPHYLWLGVAAVAMVRPVGGRTPEAVRSWLVGLAVLSIPPALPGQDAHVVAALELVFLAAATVGVAVTSGLVSVSRPRAVAAD